jgi:rhodanese-related sulfurtransferase
LATDRLQPGQSVSLVAIVDTEGFSNRITKTIALTTNDPMRQPPNQFQLTMVGNVVERQPYQYPMSNFYYDSYLLLDVRDPASYAAGHLIGAMNVPAGEAAVYGALLPPSALVVIYDQSGSASTLSSVTQALHGSGLSAVYAIYGGLDKWQKAYGAARMATGADASWGSFLDVSGARAYSGDGGVRNYDSTQLRTEYVLIDIRSASAFAAGHLAGAVNLPETSISAFVDALPRETPVIVYSEDGTDSDRVVYSLWMHGSRVKSLLGGLIEWQKQHGKLLVVASAD